MTTTKNDGGPAFPLAITRDTTQDTRKGMSLRDWFAGQALAGLRARDLEGAGERSDAMNMHHNHADICRMDGGSKRLARIAYEDADAMLEARK